MDNRPILMVLSLVMSEGNGSDFQKYFPEKQLHTVCSPTKKIFFQKQVSCLSKLLLQINLIHISFWITY